MKTSKRLVIVALISVIGLWLIVAGARAGPNPAGLAPIPTPQDLPADVGILPAAASPSRAAVTLQRVSTVTLEPRLSDMLSSTWSVHVENVFYNWPGTPYSLQIPDDARDVSARGASGPLEFVNGQASPGPEAWVTVTYRTMSQTWSYRAERLGNLIAMNLLVGGPSGQLYYSPLTTTVVYTRQFPAGAPSDQWGYEPIYAPLELQSITPAPTERSDAEGWARWVTTTNYFTSAVTLEEPLFGSDITITQVEMNPDKFVLGHSNRFTATIKNIGTMTASRWFYNELYIRPESDPPPQSAYDHNWGVITHQGDALLRKPGTEGDYKVEYLAPGAEIELFTVITVTNMMAGGVSYKVCAQADTAYYIDPLRWAWFGSNPEGYGTTSYTQEQNVAMYGPFVFNPEVYEVQVQSVSGKAPPGKMAVYRVPITNIGNVSDTYSIALTGGTWLPTAPPSIGPVLNAQTAFLPVTVTVPSTAAENTSDVFTITVTSNHDPAKTAQGTITTTAGWYGIAAFSISGRVINGGNNPISDVIVLAGSGGSATTDASGYYTITDLITDTYTLTPTKSGYTFSPPSRTVSVPPSETWQNFKATPLPSGDTHLIDLTISLYKTANTAERTPYERILGFFADAVYEMSNGAHKIRNVTIYQNGYSSDIANVIWNASEWPRANVAGYGQSGQHVWMGDSFPFDPNHPYNALAENNQLGAGYSLGHEWGHYYYGLYDEYKGSSKSDWIGSPQPDDLPVTNSVMNSQWNATNGDFNWLNFSVAKNNTKKTAQHRVYAASGWETLTRTVSLDPRNGNRIAIPIRTYYPELSAVAPASGQDSSLELPTVPTSTTRSDLHIMWVEGTTDYYVTQAQAGFGYAATIQSLLGEEASYPQPVILVASVARVDSIAKAGITTSIQAPDGSTASLALRDDGIPPDVLADDGLYSGIMPYNQGGHHFITVTFDNNAGYAEFTQASAAHSVGPNGETYYSSTLSITQTVGENFVLTATTHVLISNFKADDHGDTIQSATTLLANNVDMPGRIDRAGDIDVFQVTPSETGKLVLRVTNLALGMQPKIRLFGADGTTVINEFDYQPKTSAYFFTLLNVKAGEPFYAEVSHHDSNASIGLYDISVGSPLANSRESGSTIYLPIIIKTG